MRQQDVSGVSSLTILLNLLMFPAAAATASCRSYLLFFGVYEWTVAFLSLIFAIILRQQSVEGVRADESARSRSRLNYRLVIYGNLLTLPAATATAAFDRDLRIFCAFACVVALVSLRCAFILRVRESKRVPDSGDSGDSGDMNR